MSLLWMLLGNGAACAGAYEVLRRVRTNIPATDAVLFLIFRLLLISAAVLVAGTAGTLRPAVLGATGAVVLLFWLAAGGHRRLPRPVAPDLGWPLAILTVAVVLKILVQVWIFVPPPGDVVLYHLPKVAEWVGTGAIGREVGADVRGWFPAGFELVECWWVVFLHHDVLIEMAGVEFLVLGVVSAYALARALDFDRRTAAVAAAIFGMTPGLQLQAVGCLNDAPVAVLTVALLALIQTGVAPALLAVTVLFGVGIKPTFAFLLPGIAILHWRLGKRPTPPLPSPGTAAALGVAAFIVGLVWYARNAVLFGNPIYPMGTEAGTHIQQLGATWSALESNLGNLLGERVYDSARSPGADSLYVSNWGAAVFALGAPALVYRCRTNRNLRRLLLCSLVSMGIVFTLVNPDPWSMRFVLFFPIVPALALASWTQESRFIRLLTAAVLSVQVMSSVVPEDFHSATLSHLLGQSWQDRTLLPGPLAVPPGAEVGYYADSSGPAYLLYGPDYCRRVTYLRENTTDELYEALRRRSIQTFYTSGLGAVKREVVQEGVRRGLWTPFDDALHGGYLLEKGR